MNKSICMPYKKKFASPIPEVSQMIMVKFKSSSV